MSAGRKVFHCVVDDTAFAANFGEIKKWTSQGAITLIVPLYTLDRLRAIRKTPSATGINARESLRFLDRVTSGKHSIPASKVLLQGPGEEFENWEKAEQYLLPEFKEEAVNNQAMISSSLAVNPSENIAKPIQNGPNLNGLNEMSQMLLSKLNFKQPDAETLSANSIGTPSFPGSPATTSSHPSPEYAARQLGGSMNGDIHVEEGDAELEPVLVNPVVPDDIKPLLNAVLWRLHANVAATNVTAPGCVLITNNRTTQAWAQKFGITVKNVPQLRTSIIYEEKEFKNHCKYLEKNSVTTAAATASEPKPLLSYEDESDEDVLVFVPRGKAKSRRSPASSGMPRDSPRRVSPADSRLANGNTGARVQASPPLEPQVETPSVPIDPDSFNRNFGLSNSGAANTGNSGSRGPSGNQTRFSGPGRRGGARGGGSARGPGRGRGRLWVP